MEGIKQGSIIIVFLQDMTLKSKELTKILSQMGIKQLYPWQEKVIEKLLNGTPSQLVICPTAGGKSLTYQVPALLRDGLTLVISPLKSLMADQVLNLQAKGFANKVAFYNSSLDSIQKGTILKQISNGTIRLLYVAPERLHKDFIQYLMNLASNKICCLVIDEAHMISQAGTQFRPLYGQLAKARKLLGNPQVIALTATAGVEVKKQITKEFDILEENVISLPVVRSCVNLEVSQISNVDDHYYECLTFIKRAQNQPVLIYCSLIKYVRSLYFYLLKNNIKVAMYYTGDSNGKYPKLSPKELDQNHQDFIQDKVQVMVATSAYGMGIDKANIWGVLFNNIPLSIEELVQGIGRACRDKNLAEQHAKQNFVATGRILYNFKDLNLQKQYKINRPFDELIANSNAILKQLAYTSSICCLDKLGDIDEDKVNACIVLDRFLEENNLSTSGCFDWQSSCYNFNKIKRFKYEVFFEYLERKRTVRFNQLLAVMNFCEHDSCYNNYLHNYFTGQIPRMQKCFSCSFCSFDFMLHSEYVKEISKVVSNNSSNNIIEILLGIPNGNLKSSIDYYFRRHNETQKNFSQYSFAASLLKYKLSLINAENYTDSSLQVIEECTTKELFVKAVYFIRNCQSQFHYTVNDNAVLMLEISRNILNIQKSLKDISTSKRATKLVKLTYELYQQISEDQFLFVDYQDYIIKNNLTFIYDAKDIWFVYKKIKQIKNIRQLDKAKVFSCMILEKFLKNQDFNPQTRNLLTTLCHTYLDNVCSLIVLNSSFRQLLNYLFIQSNNAFNEMANETFDEEAQSRWKSFCNYLNILISFKENNPEYLDILSNIIKNTDNLLPWQKEEWYMVLWEPGMYLLTYQIYSNSIDQKIPIDEYNNSVLPLSKFYRCKELKEFCFTAFECTKEFEDFQNYVLTSKVSFDKIIATEALEEWGFLVVQLEQLVKWKESSKEYYEIVSSRINELPEQLLSKQFKTLWQFILENPQDLLKCYYQTSDVFNEESGSWNAQWFLSSVVSKLDFVICKSIIDCIVAFELDKIPKEKLTLREFANNLEYSYLLYPSLKENLNRLSIMNSISLNSSKVVKLPPLIKDFLIKQKLLLN